MYLAFYPCDVLGLFFLFGLHSVDAAEFKIVYLSVAFNRFLLWQGDHPFPSREERR